MTVNKPFIREIIMLIQWQEKYPTTFDDKKVKIKQLTSVMAEKIGLLLNKLDEKKLVNEDIVSLILDKSYLRNEKIQKLKIEKYYYTIKTKSEFKKFKKKNNLIFENL